MKDGQYFKGIFGRIENSPNDKIIGKITQSKDWGRFGFYSGYYYWLNKGKLCYSEYSPPEDYTEITYQEFEDWILGEEPITSEPNYEIY